MVLCSLLVMAHEEIGPKRFGAFRGNSKSTTGVGVDGHMSKTSVGHGITRRKRRGKKAFSLSHYLFVVTDPDTDTG